MKSLNELVERIKKHPDYAKTGMILCHNGVVRETSRDGRMVRGLAVEVDWDRLVEVIASQKMRRGIVDILVEINEGTDLEVGDDVMYLVVAGDIRETVLQVLGDTLDQIKDSVTAKTEYYIDQRD